MVESRPGTCRAMLNSYVFSFLEEPTQQNGQALPTPSFFNNLGDGDDGLSKEKPCSAQETKTLLKASRHHNKIISKASSSPTVAARDAQHTNIFKHNIGQ